MKEIKIGLLAFANDGGLGAQTRRLYEFLEPAKVMVIDATSFSPNKQHHLDWYQGDVTVTQGFPQNHEIVKFIEGLTHVFTVENPYNFYLVKACREKGIKVICQTNYEFCENLDSPWLPVPDLFLMPSAWKVDDMSERFGVGRVLKLPPPLDPDEFEETREFNMAKWGDGRKHKTRFIHVVGTLAWQDRNGTLDLLEAVKLSKGDYDLVIHSQHELPPEYKIIDSRIVYSRGNMKKNADLYFGYDAMILPRRYGGLSLSTNEALMSGLPVMMTDISPNDDFLPSDWLVPSLFAGYFTSREQIDYYSADHQALADKIDEWSKNPPHKQKAYSIALSHFSPVVLKPLYDQIFQ